MKQHKILKSNDCYNMMTGSPILNGEEAEKLVYYYLLDKYRDDILSIELTRDIEDEYERIKAQLRYGDIHIVFKDGKTRNIEVKEIGGVYPIDKLCMDNWYSKKGGDIYNDLYYQNKNTCDPIGWMHHMYIYHEMYIYRCGNSWYNCKLYCINEPFRIQQDVGLLHQGIENYNYYKYCLVTSDKCKNTVSVALDLNNRDAIERYGIDIIQLDIQKE